MLSQWATQARPIAELLQKGLMQLETKSCAQCYLPIMGRVCGLWEEQGGNTSVYVLGRWGDGEVACQGCIPRLLREDREWRPVGLTVNRAPPDPWIRPRRPLPTPLPVHAPPSLYENLLSDDTTVNIDWELNTCQALWSALQAKVIFIKGTVIPIFWMRNWEKGYPTRMKQNVKPGSLGPPPHPHLPAYPVTYGRWLWTLSTFFSRKKEGATKW